MDSKHYNTNSVLLKSQKGDLLMRCACTWTLHASVHVRMLCLIIIKKQKSGKKWE